MDPFTSIKPLQEFRVFSEDITDGSALSRNQTSGILGAGGGDISPQLSWSDFPEDTKSFAITVYDPDAPTGSGFWHWAVANIPATVTSLPAGAGDEGSSGLPKESVVLANDIGGKRYVGAAPPEGHGPHRYFFTVHALDSAGVELAPNSTPAVLGFALFSHAIARATIMATFEA